MESRLFAIALKVMGVPAFIFCKGGEEYERITGDKITLSNICAGAERLVS